MILCVRQRDFLCGRTRVNTLSGFLCLQGLCQASSFLFQVGLMVWNPRAYPGIKERERRWRENAWLMMGKKYIFISDAFQVLFFPAECWCIYRIQGEYLRVTSSEAAFWAIRKLRIMQENVDGRGQEKARSSRAWSFFRLPRPFLLSGLMTSNQGL